MIGAKHAFTAMCWIRFVRGCLDCITTVHAPHPPSPQPSFVPVYPGPWERMKSRRVESGSMVEVFKVIGEPFRKKWIRDVESKVLKGFRAGSMEPMMDGRR